MKLFKKKDKNIEAEETLACLLYTSVIEREACAQFRFMEYFVLHCSTLWSSKNVNSLQ